VNHKERLERATEVVELVIDDGSEAEFAIKVVAAYLGETVLYEVCPDCNGTGQIGRWEASGAFPEECSSCRTGFVQFWPVGEGDSG